MTVGQSPRCPVATLKDIARLEPSADHSPTPLPWN